MGTVIKSVSGEELAFKNEGLTGCSNMEGLVTTIAQWATSRGPNRFMDNQIKFMDVHNKKTERIQ
jgi:hypothetical protein